MAKLVMIFCLALLIGGSSSQGSGQCGRHGDPCVSDSQCCANIRCHRFANRCQIVPTEGRTSFWPWG